MESNLIVPLSKSVVEAISGRLHYSNMIVKFMPLFSMFLHMNTLPNFQGSNKAMAWRNHVVTMVSCFVEETEYNDSIAIDDDMEEPDNDMEEPEPVYVYKKDLELKDSVAR